MPAGLGYSRPPRADAIFEADKPGLIPHVLPVPLAFDDQAPVSVTGDVHGWGSRPSSGVVYAGVGDAGPAPAVRPADRKGTLTWPTTRTPR